jgi:DNA helicase II / ATP-dependent DNA helicase PcrA
MFSLDDLNPQQKEIVESNSKIIIVNAGPGTGKTKTLTSRVAYLIKNKKVEPQNILTLTFTQRAASEMRERLKIVLQNQLPGIFTFHGFAYQLLENFGRKINLISESEREEILQKIIKEKKLKYSIRDLSQVISLFKNSLDNSDNEVTRNLVTNYQKELENRELMDFDDLLQILYLQLLKDKKFLIKISQQYQHILIDEFQDTNPLQYQIIKLILGGDTKIDKNRPSLFIIGDPFQSIYGFRGVSPKLLQNLKEDFPGYQEFTLVINYRSLKNIVEVSNQLFPGVKIQAHSSEPGKLGLVKTLNEYSESQWIIDFINEKIGGSDLLKANNEKIQANFSDFAIIFRIHHLNHDLQKKMRSSGFPFQVVGEYSLYEEPEVNSLCLLLKYLIKPDERSLQELKKIVPKKDSFDKKMKQSLKIEQILPLTKIVSSLINIWGLEDQDNLNHFLGNIIQFNQYQQSLVKFVEFYENLKIHDFYDQDSDKVTLLTMHAAKGLEFKYVIIGGFEDGLIPHLKNSSELEEEKRLLYVAMTRAKEELHILYTQKREGKESKISSFKKLIESSLTIEIEDENLEKLNKKIAKKKLQKSQISLF